MRVNLRQSYGMRLRTYSDEITGYFLHSLNFRRLCNKLTYGILLNV